jgi:penicillin-binding protein 1A
LIRVDSKTGMRVAAGSGESSILEAFKPGTEPPDNYSLIEDAEARSLPLSPDADRAIMRPGTGGLY